MTPLNSPHPTLAQEDALRFAQALPGTRLPAGTSALSGADEHAGDGRLRLAERWAAWIAMAIRPARVLDLGPALDGALIEALRSSGVAADGWALDEAALAVVLPGARVSCRPVDLDTPPTQFFDLVICLESLLAVPQIEVERIVAHLCQTTGDILFSATSFGSPATTGLNIHPPEFWASLFARHGFFRDVPFDATPLTAWAIRFRRSDRPVPELVSAYEARIWQLTEECRARRAFGLEQQAQLAASETELNRTLLELESLTEANADLRAYLEPLIAQLDTAEETKARHQIEHEALERWRLETQQGIGWRMVAALQSTRSRVAPPGSRRDRWLGRYLG